jgi:SAM-dependent methyltransferase
MTDWDARYREGETPWDHGEAAPPLLELLERRPGVNWGDGPVLVPGCGRGHDAAVLAKSGRGVLGLDVSRRAVEEARELHAGVAGLEFVHGDLMDPAVRDGRPITAVWEHTCFCAIPLEMRPAYVETMAAWLPAGGRLAGVFFLDPKVECGPPFGVEREELGALFGADFEIVWEARPGRVFESRADGIELLVEMVRRP